MANNAGGIKVIAPAFGSIVVTLTRQDTGAVTAWSDAALTSSLSLPVTVTSGSSQSVYVANAGGYVLSVTLGGQQVANPLAGTTVSFSLDPGEFQTFDYSSGAGVARLTPTSTGLLAANNLSDVASAATARTNLGLGTAATATTGTFAQVANNLSDVTAATARTNLGLGTAATASTGTFAQVANNLSDVTAATARTNLGLGSWTVATTNVGLTGYKPGANGLLAAAADPIYANSQNTIGAGVLMVVAVTVETAVTIGTFWYGITTAGATLTAGQNWVGVYGNRSANTVNLLGLSADQSTNFAGANTTRSAALTVQSGQSLAIPAGTTLYCAFLFNGTTSPTLQRIGSQSTMANLNLAAPNLRSFTALTAQTTLPLTLDLSVGSASSPFWAGLS